jgi:hypothetical protein
MISNGQIQREFVIDGGRCTLMRKVRDVARNDSCNPYYLPRPSNDKAGMAHQFSDAIRGGLRSIRAQIWQARKTVVNALRHNDYTVSPCLFPVPSINIVGDRVVQRESAARIVAPDRADERDAFPVGTVIWRENSVPNSAAGISRRNIFSVRDFRRLPLIRRRPGAPL